MRLRAAPRSGVGVGVFVLTPRTLDGSDHPPDIDVLSEGPAARKGGSEQIRADLATLE